jgi:NTP pyrophosphatase (non-canonical NTP hydrolase)
MSVPDIAEYERFVDKLRFYPGANTTTGLLYAVLALNGEAGELANDMKKVLRDDYNELTSGRRRDMLSELGDVLWYLVATAHELGVDIFEVVDENMSKLADRHAELLTKGGAST